MENHPIPQDVTGFQFKLIGDMTIKQFAYLAVGVIFAWITFSLPITKLITFPIAVVFGGLGAMMAFLPIEGRPFDVMIGNYFKALFSPTQYIYQKVGGHIWFPEPTTSGQKPIQNASASHVDSSQKLNDFLKTLPQKPKNKLDEKEMDFLNSLGFSSPPPQINAQPSSTHSGYDKLIQAERPMNLGQDNPIMQAEKSENKELKQKEVELERELDEAKKEETIQIGHHNYGQAHQKVLNLEKLLSDVISQKQTLENQISALKQKMTPEQNISPFDAVVKKAEDKSSQKTQKPAGAFSGLPFSPDVPNLIMGVIKGPRQNPLPGILVEVKDISGNPVRAFKTNALGQFASATPLGNGTYSISLEDPKNQNKFNVTQLKAEGEVLMPLEIVSMDQREELRQSLFSSQQKT